MLKLSLMVLKMSSFVVNKSAAQTRRVSAAPTATAALQ